MSKKSLVLIILGGILLLLVGIQLIPYGHDHTNPPVTAEPPWDSPQTRELFYRACGDCHSNETKWPWYSNVAPISWLVLQDVEEGRSKLNVSEWGTSREMEADEASEVILEGEMPPAIYLPMHPSARLSSDEKQALAQGLSNTFSGD